MERACAIAQKMQDLEVSPVSEDSIMIDNKIYNIYEDLPVDTPDDVVSAMIIFKYFYFSNMNKS